MTKVIKGQEEEMALKLYYWDFRARAVDIRTLLSSLKINDEELNPSQEEWPGLQKSLSDSKFNFPNLPMIDDAGFKASESKAILSYLAQSKGNYTLLGNLLRTGPSSDRLKVSMMTFCNSFTKTSSARMTRPSFRSWPVTRSC